MGSLRHDWGELVTWRPLPNPDGDPPVRFDGPLDRLIRAMGAPPAAALTSVFESWSDIVGTAIGSASRPLSLTDGVLVVAVPDGGWASQLRWMERDLLDKVEAALGEGVVERLEIRVRPASEAP